MKNMPRIEISIIIGYSNLSILLSEINILEEFKTKKLEIRMRILKKFEKESLIKLSKNIFLISLGVLNIMKIVSKITVDDK